MLLKKSGTRKEEALEKHVVPLPVHEAVGTRFYTAARGSEVIVKA